MALFMDYVSMTTPPSKFMLKSSPPMRQHWRGWRHGEVLRSWGGVHINETNVLIKKDPTKISHPLYQARTYLRVCLCNPEEGLNENLIRLAA